MFDVRNIISWLRQNITKRDIILLIGLLALYFSTRLINLDGFPIFTDEGIYIHWAKVAWHDPAWRFISLTDGRQPLQTWATIPFLKLFPDNALLAGRLFAVASGVFTLSGLFAVSNYLFNKKTAFITSLLYVITPFFLFHDRMALVDSFVNGAVVWLFFLGILLSRERRLDVSLILGMFGGLALLAKSSVKLFFGLIILSSLFILIDQKKERVNKMINFIVLYCSSGLIAIVIYNIQRLSPFFHYVALKNSTFVLSFHELLQNPFQLVPGNIKFIPYYIGSEMFYVIPIIGLIGLYFLIKEKRALGLYLFLWLLGSFTVVLFAARVLYPRYIMSLGVMLLFPAGYLLSKIDVKKSLLAFFVIILSVIYCNYTILFKPMSIPFPQVDRGQYLEGWPAGWGIKEVISYAREKSKTKKVTILAEGNFGMSGDVLDASLKPTDTNIEIKAFWPLNLEHILDHLKLLDTGYVYVVFSHRSDFPESWPMKKIAQYDKPNGQSALYFYELYH